MNKPNYSNLSKRERQIMETIHALGEASVGDVVKNIPDSPSYNAIRVSMYLLTNKGFLQHRTEGNKHIYSPLLKPEVAKKTALNRLMDTYFGGSAPKVVSTLLNMEASNLSEKELDELAALIEKAKKEKNK